jgi:hypothetical protein
MSRNGSGTYTLPAGNPVVTGTTISSTWGNTTLTDIATALTGSLASDGQTTATGNLKMGANRITGLADGIASTDAASITQVTTAVAITGGSIDGTTIGTTTRSSVKATTLDLGLSTQSVAIGQGNASIMKNRIINGAMVIDQRNAGAASANTINGYFLDRWVVGQTTAGKLIAQQNAGSVTPPVGFSNYLGITSQSAYSIGASDLYYIQQAIEGFNSADLQFGTANAKTVTLSFWVRSSLTGTFGGSLYNNAANRYYPYSYTISTANTWEQKSITIAGDTTGTWVGSTNGVGLWVFFGLGVGTTFSGTANAWGATGFAPTGATSVVGTNGATFYITGVQLEVGSSATGFEYVNYQTSLANCQRYYEAIPAGLCPPRIINQYSYGAGSVNFSFPFLVQKRTSPTGTILAGSTFGGQATAVAINGTNTTGYEIAITTSGAGFLQYFQNGLTFSAEL